MNRSTAGTLSVVLSILMWPLGAFGFFTQLVDFKPGTSPHDMWVEKGLIGGSLLTLAFLLFVGAAWLSGFAFPEAKRRSILSAILCAAFPGFIFWGGVLAPFIAL